jgi:hypothetical protein
MGLIIEATKIEVIIIWEIGKFSLILDTSIKYTNNSNNKNWGC